MGLRWDWCAILVRKSRAVKGKQFDLFADALRMSDVFGQEGARVDVKLAPFHLLVATTHAAILAFALKVEIPCVTSQSD